MDALMRQKPRYWTRFHAPPICASCPRASCGQFADELRTDLIDIVSVTGGHSVPGGRRRTQPPALHYVFNTPADRLIWDVGHQAYPHKIITGRRSRNAQPCARGAGFSGFTKRSESEYDPFGAAHSSTSISAGLGHGAWTRRPQGRKE